MRPSPRHHQNQYQPRTPYCSPLDGVCDTLGFTTHPQKNVCPSMLSSETPRFARKDGTLVIQKQGLFSVFPLFVKLTQPSSAPVAADRNLRSHSHPAAPERLRGTIPAGPRRARTRLGQACGCSSAVWLLRERLMLHASSPCSRILQPPGVSRTSLAPLLDLCGLLGWYGVYRVLFRA